MADREHDQDGDARPGTAVAHDRPNPPEQPKKPISKRPVLMTVLVLVVLAAAAGGLFWWLRARQFESTDDAFIAGHAVQMAPKVPGYVVQLRVEDNQLVHRGDFLLEIDPRDYQSALDQAKAGLASAEAKVTQAEAQEGFAVAGVVSARAIIAAAQANADNAHSELARIEKLVPSGAATPQARDATVSAVKTTESAVVATQARLTQAEAQEKVDRSLLAVARAGLRQADTQVQQAELNLSYTRLTAPVTGRVTHRTVERGDYLQPGQALFAVVEPAVWVVANYKETQLTDMRVGQPVTLAVDAYPHRTFAAHVDSFQRGTGARFSLLPPENATGNYVKVVQRVPVKIVFDEAPDEDLLLAPGMSVVPKVRVR
jgi:membrane fusion protein (multidrug efflux system)